MRFLGKCIEKTLLLLGFSIRRTNDLVDTSSLVRLALNLRFLSESLKTFQIPIREAVRISGASKSQLGQDVLALSLAGHDQPGFFVEFGATNGIDLSNTFLLEKEFGWQGILCEPARIWHEDLNRTRQCAIDHRCVYSASGETVSFSETSAGELSTISSFTNSDGHKDSRTTSATYEVETVSLIDLLGLYDAPKYIDFLSIDTEGSEYEILKAFDFGRYSFGLICVEHNYTANRAKIKALLESNNYSQIYSDCSQWDDWYALAKDGI